jgi:hypothetical protein
MHCEQNSEKEPSMTQARKRAVFTFLIWGVVMAAFSVMFFFGDGPERYHVEKWRRVAGAAVIAFGYLSYWAMLVLTRAKMGGPAVATDERDLDTRRRATSTGFLVTLVYVFALAIFLWERYQVSGVVPVGWMWFLAYSTSFAAFISSSIAALILDSKASADAQG